MRPPKAAGSLPRDKRRSVCLGRGRVVGHSSIATTAKIYAHALRGKDVAAAQIWDDIKEQARGEKPGAVLLT